MSPDATWAEDEFGEADLGDVRRNARLVQLATVLGAQPSASLPDATDDPATLKAAYRFFDNDYVRAEAMLASHVQSTTRRMQAVPLVLAVQDTTYLDWTDHPATDGLGPLAAPSHQGLLAHTTLALTPERVPLGLLAQQVWTRDPNEVGKRARRKQLPISQKESQKWLHSLDALYTARDCCPTTHLISVGDREADVYDVLAAPRPVGVDLLIRASWNRCVNAPQRYVWDTVVAQPVAAQLLLHVPRRGPQPAREATLALRYCPLTLCPPQHRKAEGLPAITLWAVQVCEVEPPAEVEPIEWLLCTTLAVGTVDDAIERVQGYSCRWGIEVWHRVLKSGGRIAERQLA